MNQVPGSRVFDHSLLALVDRYRLLIDESSDVVVRVGRDGVIEWMSPAVTTLLGSQPDEIEGLSPIELAHPDDVPIAMQAKAALDRGCPVDLRLRMRRASGEYVWVGIRAKPFLQDGVVAGRVANWRDISAEHEAVETLARQEHVFRWMIDQAADMVLSTTEGTVTWVSAGIERSTGWRADELIGHSSIDKVYPDDRRVLARLRSMRDHTGSATARFRFVCRDGALRWMEVVSSALRMPEGAPGAVSVMRDITERVEAEQERDRLEHRLHATLDALMEPHVHLSPMMGDDGGVVDLEVTSANPAACAHVRRPAEELVGYPLSNLLPSHLDDGLVARAREVLVTQTPYVADDLRSWNDLRGEHRWYDIRLIPVDGSASLTFRDVTERRLRHDAEARVQALQALSTERARVARDLHDGAIQKVFATSMRLAALASELPEQARGRLEELIDLQDAVIRDLRATVYQLGTTGRSSASPGRSVHDTVTEAARALGFMPEVMVDDHLPPLDDVVLGHLLLVTREALSNVARHARASHVEVSLIPAGSEVILSVWDDGVGFSVEGLQGDGLRNISRRAELLGGCSRMISEPGGGTEVIWRVPQSAR